MSNAIAHELTSSPQEQPLSFNITVSRTYRWQTESPQDQAAFISSLVQLFRSLNGGAPLQLMGVRDPDTADGPSGMAGHSILS